MKFDLETIVVIIIVILFVGSIFGYAFSTNNGTSTRKENKDIKKDINENAPIVTYSTEIDSNLLDIYPQLIISSNTKEYNKDKLEDLFRRINGVKKVSLNFTKGKDKEIVLIGKIQFKSENKDEIIKKIKDMNFLSDTQFYMSGLVSIPKGTVKLYDDQNREKDYQFTDNKIEGIVNINSIKNDQLKVELEIMFKGERPYRFLAFEIKNLTSSPKTLSENIKLPIASWNKNIRIILNSNLENSVDENIIKNIFGDLNITIDSREKGELKYIFDENKPIEDINSYFKEIKDENKIIEYKLDENSLTIMLKDDENKMIYKNLKDSLKSKFNLNEEDINSEVIKEYIINIFGEDNINKNKYLEELNENNLEIKKIEKEAIFNISNIKLNNKKYTYDENTTVAWLDYPEDLNKTEVELNIFAYTSRDKILFATLSK